MDPRLVFCSGKYRIEKLIGEGAFGKIYSGIILILLNTFS